MVRPVADLCVRPKLFLFTTARITECRHISTATTGYSLPGVGLGEYLTLQAQLPLPLFYNFVGDGQGTLVFDASNDIYSPGPGSLDGNEDGITANPDYQDEADLRYRTVGDVIWGSNIEMFDYAPQYDRAPNLPIEQAGPTEVINNPVNGEIHYILNPNAINAWERVEIRATLGQVEIDGDGQYTRVDLDPAYSQSISELYVIENRGLLPGWGAGAGQAVSICSPQRSSATSP